MASSWRVAPADEPRQRRVVVSGQFDLSAEQHFVDDVQTLLDDSVDEALLDLGSVDFIDSSGVRAILRLRAANPGKVRVAEASPAVRRVLDIAGLGDLLFAGDSG